MWNKHVVCDPFSCKCTFNSLICHFFLVNLLVHVIFLWKSQEIATFLCHLFGAFIFNLKVFLLKNSNHSHSAPFKRNVFICKKTPGNTRDAGNLYSWTEHYWYLCDFLLEDSQCFSFKSLWKCLLLSLSTVVWLPVVNISVKDGNTPVYNKVLQILAWYDVSSPFFLSPFSSPPPHQPTCMKSDHF